MLQKLISATLKPIIFVAGLATLCYGVWQMYEPAAFVVFGCVLLAVVLIDAWMIEKDKAARRPKKL